jgi:hypothetical protein
MPIMVPTVVADVSDPAGVIAYAVGVLSAAMRARSNGTKPGGGCSVVGRLR